MFSGFPDPLQLEVTLRVLSRYLLFCYAFVMISLCYLGYAFVMFISFSMLLSQTPDTDRCSYASLFDCMKYLFASIFSCFDALFCIIHFVSFLVLPLMFTDDEPAYVIYYCNVRYVHVYYIVLHSQ